MLKKIAALSSLMMIASIHYASASVASFDKFGNWDAISDSGDNGIHVCGIIINGIGRAMGLTRYASNPEIEIRIYKKTWQIPDSTLVPVILSFSGFTPFSAKAYGSGKFVIAHIPVTLWPTFESQFRSSQTLTIAFKNGNEPNWVVILDNSDHADDDLEKCISKMDIGTTEPFAPSQGAPTQPFSNAPNDKPSTAPDNDQQDWQNL